MGQWATKFLAESNALRLPDLVLAEVVYVLQSFYKVERPRVAALARAIVSSRTIRTTDPALLVRAIDGYEQLRLSFVDAYLVALAEAADEGRIASFDKGIDRAGKEIRIEPA